MEEWWELRIWQFSKKREVYHRDGRMVGTENLAIFKKTGGLSPRWKNGGN